MSRAATVAEVLRVAVDEVVDAIGASAAVAYVAAGQGMFQLSAARGLSAVARERLWRMPADSPLPLFDALRAGEPIWIERRAELLVRYPTLARSDLPQESVQSVAALPLVCGGQRLGGLALSFAEVHDFDSEERQFLLALVELAALAAERCRLHDQEQASRLRATALANASKRFSEARLSLPPVLDAVVREIAETYQQACTINLLSADGQVLSPVAAHDVDPAAAQSMVETMARAPVRMDEDSLLAQVARSGKALLLSHVPLAELSARTRPEYRAHLERYPLSSLAIVPLRSAERVLGTLTVSRAPGARPLTSEDLALFEELAERATLAIESARLYEAAQRAREQAERASQARDQLLAVVSHDLRTPLSAVVLRTTSLAAAASEGSAVQGHARAILHSAQRMSRLIADLLDMASLERGRLSLRPGTVSPAAIVADSVELLAQSAGEQGVTLSQEVAQALPSIVGDRQRLVQALCNLASNAIKVSPRQALVQLRARNLPGELVFEVVDRGPGIAPEHLERIFERNFRAPDAPYEGSGLGLSIARGIAEAHGGRVWAESTLGQGSTFFLALPIGCAD